jgi:L-lactate dehydrogenase complex protein LldG
MTPSDQARALVLSRIRAGLGVAGRDRTREAAVEERLRAHPRNTIPARARAGHEALLELMATMLAAQGAEVTRAATPEDAVRAIAEDLRKHDLPSRLRVGGDAQLAALPWETTPEVERVFGPAEGADRASLSRAVVAAAETGTLVLVSGADNPTTLAFLPETHFILVRAGDVVGSYEEAFDRLRAIYGERHGEVHGRPSRFPRIKSGVAPQDDGRASNHAGSYDWPRTVNLISGPSRTADIEQTIVRGAHGPKRLHVMLLG